MNFRSEVCFARRAQGETRADPFAAVLIFLLIYRVIITILYTKESCIGEARRERLRELTGGTHPVNLMDPMRMPELFFGGEDAADLSAERAFVMEQLRRRTEEELLKICAELPFLEGVPAITAEGKPDLEKIAEAYLEVLMEDGGLAVTDFEGFYDGDLEQFKAYAKEDIESMFSAEE